MSVSVNIACPNCNHEAFIPLDVLPKPSVLTTCPKCKYVTEMYYFIIVGASKTKLPELMITYTDGKGIETDRDISNIRYSSAYQFHAYCHLRKEDRTFLTGRVVEAIDIRTGNRILEYQAKWGSKGKTRTIYF